MPFISRRQDGSMMMNRSRTFLLVAITLAFGGCGTAGTASTISTTTASPDNAPSPSAVPVNTPAAIPSPTPTPTPIPTLASTTENASTAPRGAISIKMTVPNGEPRFQPDHVTARSGTVVFFLENVPGPIFDPDHNMQIGPAIGQVTAGTPRIRATETATFTVKDLTSGTYVFWCPVVGLNGEIHAKFGMVGTLTITP